MLPGPCAALCIGVDLPCLQRPEECDLEWGEWITLIHVGKDCLQSPVSWGGKDEASDLLVGVIQGVDFDLKALCGLDTPDTPSSPGLCCGSGE